ncbi:MAG: two-component system chemotaxis response regulator CheY [Alteromonadaceae bacterium]|jgi:two-component system chemotaxis response regulator CheY
MKKHVLLADDNDKVRSLLKSFLESFDYQVVEARDGLDGLTKAKTMAFDLFVIDYRMPIMDGITLIKGLKKIPLYSELPMVLVTTDDSFDFLAKVADLDNVEVLNKPVERALLKAALEASSELAAA